MLQSPPILLVYFNRPEILRRNLAALAAIRPQALFLATDGARADNATDAANIQRCHNLVAEMVTWECQVRTLRSPTNHGVDLWVPKAIDWFFTEVEQGIILEDDCVISDVFYDFASELLDTYREEPRVMNISAANFQRQSWGAGDYYVSRYPSNWGWATWRRAWAKFDPQMTGLDEFVADQVQRVICADDECRYWKRFFEGLKRGKYTYWDAKWVYSIWRADGVSITPNSNLVSNIGHGADATHTKAKDAGMEGEIGTLPWPPRQPTGGLKVCTEADNYLFRTRYKPTVRSRLAALRGRIGV